MQIMRVAICLLLLMGMHAALAAGDAKAGKTKAEVCSACHGFDGNSSLNTWPKLAGQHVKYLVDQLKAFKAGPEGPRNNAIMYAAVVTLSEQDMHDIAAFYATQQIKLGSTPPDYVDLGQKLYRGGDRERGIPACGACHGPRGIGNAQAGYPRLSGQHAEYTMAQLKAYRSGERKTGPNHMMQTISARLTDEDITALAHYLAGLH